MNAFFSYVLRHRVMTGLQTRYLGTEVMTVDGAPPNGPLSDTDKRDITDAFFPVTNPFIRRPPDMPERPDDFRYYFKYFEEACEYLDRREHAAETYHDLTKIVGYLRRSRGTDRATLCTDLKQIINKQTATNEQMFKSIQLGIRLWLMLGLGEMPPEPGLSRTPMNWGPDKSINDILDREFKPDESVPQNRDREFSNLFTLRDMEHLSGFQIQWTDDIANHLRIVTYPQREFRRSVFIFHHAVALKELDFGSSRLILARETLQTLGLLIPTNDELSQRWFEKRTNRDRGGIDRTAARQDGSIRRVRDYRYWRNRLLALEAEFEASESASVWTYWNDRRKPRNWATFWVAVAALSFAILAVIFAFIQTVLAGDTFKETKLANSIAGGASRAADTAAAALSSALASFSNLSKVATITPIVACCCPGRMSASSSSFGVLAPFTTHNPAAVTVTPILLTGGSTASNTTRCWQRPLVTAPSNLSYETVAVESTPPTATRCSTGFKNKMLT